jgi:peptidoglycan/LPS O-acetylase OafA/YrhL
MRNHQRYLWPTVLIGLSLARASERVIADALHLAEPARQATDVGPTVPWIELAKLIACAVVFSLAVYDRLPMLRWKPVVALGAISYPLYLLHQNIGYIVMGVLHEAAKVPADVAILIAIVVVLALATVVSFAIERPSMHALRRFYLRKTHHVAPETPLSGLAPAVAVTPADRTP